MSLLQKEATIIVSSDPDLGAINRSTDGSSFEIPLEDALEIPKNAINCNICVESATIWWTCPNVITGQNDKLYIYGDSNALVPVPQLYIITIPQGLYDLTGLNTSILSQLENLGAKSDPSPLINLTADSNTQRVNIKFNYSNVYVDFSQATTPREILGFNSAVYGPYATVPINILAPNTAGFNTINYFLIGSDLVRHGIRFNNTYAGVISQVLIDVSPGSQIVSTPFNPSRIQCDELIGSKRTNLRFRLTDDKLRAVNTNGEFYSCRIVIRYNILSS
jgi:hypothetical protein